MSANNWYKVGVAHFPFTGHKWCFLCCPATVEEEYDHRF